MYTWNGGFPQAECLGEQSNINESMYNNQHFRWFKNNETVVITLLKGKESYIAHPTQNLNIKTHLNWRYFYLQDHLWISRILASYQILSIAEILQLCVISTCLLWKIKQRWIIKPQQTLAQTWLINNSLATKKVSVHLFINYSQHCGSLPRFSPKWVHGHMLWLSFGLTQISKWISYCMEDRSFHAFLQRAVNLISPFYYTVSHRFLHWGQFHWIKTFTAELYAQMYM